MIAGTFGMRLLVLVPFLLFSVSARIRQRQLIYAETHMAVINTVKRTRQMIKAIETQDKTQYDPVIHIGVFVVLWMSGHRWIWPGQAEEKAARSYVFLPKRGYQRAPSLIHPPSAFSHARGALLQGEKSIGRGRRAIRVRLDKIAIKGCLGTYAGRGEVKRERSGLRGSEQHSQEIRVSSQRQAKEEWRSERKRSGNQKTVITGRRSRRMSELLRSANLLFFLDNGAGSLNRPSSMGITIPQHAPSVNSLSLVLPIPLNGLRLQRELRVYSITSTGTGLVAVYVYPHTRQDGDELQFELDERVMSSIDFKDFNSAHVIGATTMI
ncbi:hypothetical protein C8R44DRAFT_734765 [Mycena epipterygia]|nr:hypothetical protein C8R44DRAFT_734765 [Mycena epipterygia]